MRAFMVVMAVIGLFAGVAAAEDRILATDIQGGPPLAGKDGKPIPPQKKVLAELRGADFERVRAQAQAVIQQMGKETIWWDVGPDAGYVSVVIELSGKTYTVNSWYPRFKDKDTVAVTEGGLVAVANRAEKLQREGQNGEKYQALIRFLDAVLAKPPPPKPPAK